LLFGSIEEERQNTLQERMLKTVQPWGWPTMLADAKFTLLGAALSVLPPSLLNLFSDADVKAHAEKRCSKPAAASATRANSEL